MLDDAELKRIAELAIATERHNGCPQDTEWAISNGATYLVQARPITTLRHTAAPTSDKHAVLARGLAAAPGMASGKVRVLETPDEGDRLLEGEILVAQMTNPDWLPTIRRAAALVTNTGGMTCHAAIVARELGVPCVVGTRTGDQRPARRDDRDRRRYPRTGAVRAGRGDCSGSNVDCRRAAHRSNRRPRSPAPRSTSTWRCRTPRKPLRRRDPTVSACCAPNSCSPKRLGGRHPRDLIAHGEQNTLVDGTGRRRFCRIAAAFAPRPVVYRATDFRSNEFRGLKGGDAYEPDEHNPMIGYRGCYRYVKEPDLFALELQALARVREQSPNVHLMIPFVRTRWELEECLSLVDASPLGRQRGLHRWVMAEVPSVDALAARVHRDGYRRGVDRQQRPDPVGARSRPRLRRLRRVVRRIRSRGTRRDRSDHQHRTQIRDNVLAVRPGAVDQAGLRRAPRPDGHHVGVGEPGCAGCRPADDRRGRTTADAGICSWTT